MAALILKVGGNAQAIVVAEVMLAGGNACLINASPLKTTMAEVYSLKILEC
eukprot:gene33596-40642_t